MVYKIPSKQKEKEEQESRWESKKRKKGKCLITREEKRRARVSEGKEIERTERARQRDTEMRKKNKSDLKK